jgi:hypothetical protein
MKPILALCATVWLVAVPTMASAQTAADRFFSQLQTLCGKSFTGQVVTGDAVDEPFRKAELVITLAQCDATEIRIPFRVGEDRSRTWVITRLGEGRLRLKHDHRHADGVEDELSRYGGDAVDAGSVSLQSFPVDAESRALFTRLDRAVSNTNVWSLGLTQDVLTYQLARPGRLFRVSFDLTRPRPAP